MNPLLSTETTTRQTIYNPNQNMPKNTKNLFYMENSSYTRFSRTLEDRVVKKISIEEKIINDVEYLLEYSNNENSLILLYLRNLFKNFGRIEGLKLFALFFEKAFAFKNIFDTDQNKHIRDQFELFIIELKINVDENIRCNKARKLYLQSFGL